MDIVKFPLIANPFQDCRMRHPTSLSLRPVAAIVTAIVTVTLSALAIPGLNAQGRGAAAPAGPPPASGVVNGKLGPIVKDGMMQPVAEFADSTQIIRQSVWV